MTARMRLLFLRENNFFRGGNKLSAVWVALVLPWGLTELFGVGFVNAARLLF